jgi:hypothetical protein
MIFVRNPASTFLDHALGRLSCSDEGAASRMEASGKIALSFAPFVRRISEHAFVVSFSVEAVSTDDQLFVQELLLAQPRRRGFVLGNVFPSWLPVTDRRKPGQMRCQRRCAVSVGCRGRNVAIIILYGSANQRIGQSANPVLLGSGRCWRKQSEQDNACCNSCSIPR